jgi:MFS family permease
VIVEQKTPDATLRGLPVAPAPQDLLARPAAVLPASQLLRISAYWLGLTAIDSAVGLFAQNRIQFGGLVDPLSVGRTLFLVTVGGAIVSILVQPTVGYLSDFTVSRWGRRKPYIVVGSLLDVVFLLGIAWSQSLLALAAFILLLSVSTNIARGPFQGYVPDLVADRQVGLASALVGLMQIVGNVTGFALGSFAAIAGNLPLALVAVALIELVTMLSVVLRVGVGQPARPREGRSWVVIARGAWSKDVLRERSYVWLVGSRLLFLVGGGVLVNVVIVYLSQVHGLDQTAANEANLTLLAIVVVANALAIVPAARLSDRVGRKPLIYASCGIGGVGIVVVALAPSIPIALLGGALFGISAGMFLAVDWALMTDIIPRESAGRFMGLSNVATGASTPISIALAGVIIDIVNTAAGHVGPGPRIAYLVGAAFCLAAAITLRPVREPRRNRASQDLGAPS